MIDDADDAGVDRGLGGIERKARFLAAHEEHILADAGADRIRPRRSAGRRAARSARERLHQQQLDAGEVRRPCAVDDDVADDTSRESASSTIC